MPSSTYVKYQTIAHAANKAMPNVLTGTPVTPLLPTNTFVFFNSEQDGDLAIVINKGGNSQAVFWADASAGDTAVMASSGASVDHYIAGTKVLDHASGAFAFQESTTLSSTGTLTINAFSLGGKLTAGANEIEGSAFDIDGGDISAVTISGGLTWSNGQNFDSQGLSNVNIDSGTIDGVTITDPTINGTIETTGLTMPAFEMDGTLNTGGNSITGSAYTITTSSGNLTLTAAVALSLTAGTAIDFSKNLVAQADALQIIPWQTTNTYLRLMAYDTGVGNVEVARMQGAADPYFAMGGSQEFKYTNGNLMGVFGATPVGQQLKAAHNNWAALSDVVSALVNLGFIDSV